MGALTPRQYTSTSWHPCSRWSREENPCLKEKGKSRLYIWKLNQAPVKKRWEFPNTQRKLTGTMKKAPRPGETAAAKAPKGHEGALDQGDGQQEQEDWSTARRGEEGGNREQCLTVTGSESNGKIAEDIEELKRQYDLDIPGSLSTSTEYGVD
ncbi:hypothetical protein NHX12_011047 [Muraenolepis orangiensis]|uniref:Uncharacterized protein n=1 Tax=Muraenolepis orangiensis TaxID=630683 RepID=A0A9Q0DI68_9TELE|nr:hypothetical protein NHX12_011047 [Muraenolepis orangiensis]